MAVAKLTMSDASSAAQADIEKFKEAVGEIEAEAGGAEPGATRDVTIGDPIEPEKREPDDDDGEPRPSRRERRGNRYAEAEQARIRAEAERDLLRQQLDQQRQQPVFQQPPGPAAPDPLEAMIARTRQEYRDIHELYTAKANAGTLSQEEVQKFQDKGWEVQDKLQQLNAARVVRRLQMNQPQAPAEDPVQTLLRSEYPDVYSNEALLKRSGLIFDNLVLDGHDPRDLRTARESLKQAREKYGTRQRPDPDDSVRQKLSGLPSGPGNGGGSRGGGTVKMTPELQRMAKSAYPKLYQESPQKAYQKWANDVGPGFLEDERRAGR